MIFVGGTGRSGTTIVGKVLEQYAKLTVLFEPRFLTDPQGLMDYLTNPNVTADQVGEALQAKFLPKLLNNFLLRTNLASPAHVYKAKVVAALWLKATRTAAPRSEQVRRFTLSMARLYRRDASFHTLVYKEPHVILWARALLVPFPGAHLVHLIRDPRDVCASVLGVNWGPQTPEDFVPWYLTLSRNAWEHMQGYPQEQYHVLSLEALVDDPEHQIAALYSWLNLHPPHKVILAGAKLIEQSQAHIGRYQEDLTPEMAESINAACQESYQQWLDLSIA